MTSTFKLTSAEFKKIFKRPSIFIMAILLVVTILISFTIFNPATLVDPLVVYDNATTSMEYYDIFNSDLPNSKTAFDNGFAKTDKVVNYYKALNNHSILLTTYHNDIKTTMDKIINETNASIKNEHRTTLTQQLKNYITTYKTLDSLKDFQEIVSVPLTQFEYKTYADKINYYSTEACVALERLYSHALDTANTTADELVNIYFNPDNHYESDLNNVLDNGINFVQTTIRGLVRDFDDFYYKYSAIKGNSGLDNLKSYRYNLHMIVSTLDEYLDTLVGLDYPVIIISDEDYQNINYKLEEAIAILKVNTTADSSLQTHSDIKVALENAKILSNLKGLIEKSQVTNEPTIQQIHLNKLTEFDTIKSKVDENKSTILEKINSLKNDESSTNISYEITNYSLLEKSYNTLVLDKIYLNITDNHDASEYNNYYGTVFKDFNKYECRERITTNNYYIENNKYSQDFLTNFSYSQNSGNKTNVYDFMYFTLELCAVIIIVFAMMLVCSLITGETESGTIKLLLVRPYKRSKIITAKLLATIFFVLTFMLFSSIITYVGGLVVYGNATLPVLSVLNSNTVFTASPLLLMILNILSLSIDIIFFVLLALMISILCKNYAASISCSLFLLIINYAFNILFGSTFWYTMLPGMNLHMFKYFGNAFTSTIAGTSSIPGIIQSVLITGIHSSMTFPFSIFMYIIYSLVFLAVSYSVFQKRDF